MKPIIGIISRAGIESSNTQIEYINEEYRIAIIKNGGIPFLILPYKQIKYYQFNNVSVSKEEKEYLKLLIDKCDGILFPGGYKWYKYEEYIFKYAYRKNIPILGICCGMQMIGIMLENKNTLKKIESNINHHQENKKYVHDINILNDTLLYKIIKKSKIKVNSRHNEYLKSINNLKVSAYSEDGLIEAIEDEEKKFVLGIQWHPESMINYDLNQNNIYKYFVNICKKDS